MGRKFGFSFSWKRAVGVSALKGSIARSTGIPLTKQGRQRKVGNAAGCSFVFFVFIAASTLLLSGCTSASSPVVKKSSTGICHQEGTLFYKNTKNFTAYNSISDCLESGGRLPKK
jgi:hypothetical protein